MRLTYYTGILAFACVSIAVAHEGVKNPVVAARMDGMSAIANNLKVIGNMARGKSEFDATAAQQALAAIASQASRTPALFEQNEEDPLSEARPEIWRNFDDFTARALELATVASQLAPTLDTRDDLPAALGRVAENCKSCHGTYRQ